MSQLSIPSTQGAVILKQIGKPLEWSQLPVLAPGEDEVLVKVHAAGLVPIDWELRDHGILSIRERLPAVLGFEGVGTIVRQGTEGSIKFPIGTKVIFKGGATQASPFLYGALQEYVPTQSRYLAAVPEDCTSEQAATLSINPFTAAVCLFHEAGINIPLPSSSRASSYDYSSQSLVVLGAGTSVGKFIVQFARIVGFRMIVAIASPSSLIDLKSYGATHLIDRHSPDIVAQVLEAVANDLKYVIDATPGANAEPDRNLEFFKRPGGTLVQLSVGESFKESSKSAAAVKGVNLKRIFADYSIQPDFATEWVPLFQTWLGEKKIQIPSFEVIPALDASKVNAALDDIKAAKSGVRYVVKIST
ncbi:hypothetical protein FOMG_13279 [Fusarium oxysporum f. sp. melonis 26406]|uniref:Enoyl reductase (ER) domain-containing protein n=1 Tax=Fusarium oxysporum f. sp. melonis 26406 TaxID=1089452 RepID=W9ZQ88_FUSOX|nr:hypothetical protein FOMG_13279 [Fusarium oxysporum f. sp. melonis 26406]